MTNASTRRCAGLGLLIAVYVSCAQSIKDRDDFSLPTLELESIPLDPMAEPAPAYVEWAGRPDSDGDSAIFYPEGEAISHLATCIAGSPACPGREPCLGWAEFAFSVSEFGVAEAPTLMNACPFPILTEPLLRALAEWRFKPWNRPGLSRKEAWTSTLMAFPIDPVL